MDQLLVSEGERHNKLVEGEYSFTPDPRNDSQGYRYFYTPSTPAAGGTITAYTILARPQKFGPGGRANFFMDQSSVVHWTTQNRPATASDALWNESSPQSSGQVPDDTVKSVLTLETHGDEILKTISVEYHMTPVMSTALNQPLKPGKLLCLGNTYAASAILHTDRALAFGEVPVPPGVYCILVKRGSGQEWELAVSKYFFGSICSNYVAGEEFGSVPLSEALSLTPQANLAFNLSKQADGVVLRIELGEKELAVNLFGNGDQMITDFEKAIQFDPSRAAQPQSRQAADDYKRGVALAKDGKDGEATAAYEKAIQLAPKRFEYYEALEGLLSKRSEWQNIITLWTQFIALVPDNGHAYCERGGAYSHLHDLPNVLKDGDKACSLGYQECCDNMKKFRLLYPTPTPVPPGVTAPPPRQ